MFFELKFMYFLENTVMKKLLILLALFLPLPASAEEFCSTEFNICLTAQELQLIQTAAEKEMGAPAGKFDGWIKGEFSKDVTEQDQKFLAHMVSFYIAERDLLQHYLEEGFPVNPSINREPFLTPNGQEYSPADK